MVDGVDDPWSARGESRRVVPGRRPDRRGNLLNPSKINTNRLVDLNPSLILGSPSSALSLLSVRSSLVTPCSESPQ